MFPDSDKHNGLSYAKMMSNCEKLLHGQDFDDFKHCPKFIGICLRRLNQGSVTVENFLAKYQQSKSL